MNNVSLISLKQSWIHLDLILKKIKPWSLIPKTQILSLMDLKKPNRTNSKLIGLRSNPRSSHINHLMLCGIHCCLLHLSLVSPSLIGSLRKSILILWWKGSLPVGRVWKLNRPKTLKLDLKMLQEWKTQKNKLLNLLISWKIVKNMLKWALKYPKELYLQVHLVPVRQCLLKPVPDKQEHLFFMFQVLNLSKCLSVWVHLVWENYLQRPDSRPLQLFLSMK